MNEWISVKDGLPEDDEEYGCDLVWACVEQTRYGRDGKVKARARFCSPCTYNHEHRAWTDELELDNTAVPSVVGEDDTRFLKTEVILWQPLPGPPEAQRE